MIDPNLPLIDLHRHLDGNVRLETILDLGEKHNLPLPAQNVEDLRPYVQVVEPVSGVMDFIDKFEWMIGVLVDYDACRRIAFENVEDAFHEGLDYVELRFSPVFMSQPHDLDPAKVVAAVVEGINQGRKAFDIKVNLIGIISRSFGVDKAWKELESLLSKKEEIVALDLAGDEANYPGELFREHIEKGRSAGWKTTIHAGEEAGPESVWQAIEELQADRIGHGVSSIHDPALMEKLKRDEIGLEINLTSNLQTNVVSSLQEHPLRRFLENGILATINTDDPGISGIDLRHEYSTAATAAGLTPALIQKAQRNALEVAFMTREEKSELLAKKQSRVH
ncbi:MAG: adenosine deaminase [Anaerolineales bacterium]|nr:adenosine deaminase [Anaerolineales bacterium]